MLLGLLMAVYRMNLIQNIFKGDQTGRYQINDGGATLWWVLRVKFIDFVYTVCTESVKEKLITTPI